MARTPATSALVSTPLGIGAAGEVRPGDFARVQFPWGHAYMRREQVAASPEFTFYALTKTQHVKFSLPFSLASPGAEMIAAVQRRLEIPAERPIALVQTDSVDKHEIRSDRTIGECTVGAGPRHPVLVLQAPIMRFKRTECSRDLRLEEQDTRATQTAPGFRTVFGDCEVSRGVKYWEVKLVAARGGDGVFIGVAATGDAPADGGSSDNGLRQSLFWGFSCATGYKVHDSIDYFADPCADGDVVGALLDKDCGRLSFYLNGRYLGVAFTGVKAARLRPAFALTSAGQEIELLPAVSPPLH